MYRAAGVRPTLTVVYVHGFYTNVDEAWKQHQLPGKFTRSRLPAVFVVPEAPTAAQEPVRWRDLEALLDVVRQARPRLLPTRAPVLAVGHSAAYKTIVNWLPHPQLQEVMLVDALYGFEDEYADWLLQARQRRLVVLVRTTEQWVRNLTKRLRFGMRLDAIPDKATAKLRSSRLVVAQSQHGHMELVTEPDVLINILRLSRYARR